MAIDQEFARSTDVDSRDGTNSDLGSESKDRSPHGRRLAIAAVAALLAVASTAAGATLLSPHPDGRSAATDQQSTDNTPDLASSLAGSSTGLGPLPGSGATRATEISSGAESAALLATRTESLIRYYESRATTVRDATESRVLASLYLARGRVTGDAATYLRAQAAATRAQEIAPNDPEVISILASADATLHEFGTARALGERVLVDHPTAFGARAIVGDAALETGDYETAARSYAALSAVLPNNSGVLVREARLASINGDLARARTLAARASAVAVTEGAFGTTLAFPRAFQGKLALDAGQYAEAEAFYRGALQAADGWHVALAGLSRARVARGDLAGAIVSLQQAIDVVPLPEYLSALGDVLTAQGKVRAARSAYATVDATASLAGSRLYDRQRVLYLADHATSPDARTAQAVSLARNELQGRKDVFGYDALAWALFADGRAQEALPYLAQSLALRTEDPALHFHAGMIYAATGNRVSAIAELRQALSQSPRFDVVGAGRAQSMLTSLTAG